MTRLHNSETRTQISVIQGGFLPRTKKRCLFLVPDGTVGFVVPRESGGCVIGLGKTVSHFDWDGNGDHSVLAEVDRGKDSRFNDAKCDPSGRLWCGSYILLSFLLSFSFDLKSCCPHTLLTCFSFPVLS